MIFLTATPPEDLFDMDIVYMKTSNGFTNDSDFVHSDFIAQHPCISIPYLILISISTVTGCIANVVVIGSVVTYKVFKDRSFTSKLVLFADKIESSGCRARLNNTM